MTLPLPPYFAKALEKEKAKYADWYASNCLSEAEEMDEPECGYNQRGHRSRNSYRIYAPGDYEHGDLSIKGEDLYNSEYADKEAYFDLAAQSYYLKVLHHRTLKASNLEAYTHKDPEDYAFDEIQEFDFDMDLPSIIYGVWEDLQKAEKA